MKKIALCILVLIAIVALSAAKTPVNTASPPSQGIIAKNTVQVNNQNQTSCQAILPTPTLLICSPPNLVENQQKFRCIDITCKAPANSKSPPMGAADNSYFILSNSPAPAQSAIIYYDETNIPALPGNTYFEDSGYNNPATGFNRLANNDVYNDRRSRTSNNMTTYLFC